MDETMTLINQVANERHMLYRLAAKEHLSPIQKERLQKLDSDLVTLWDNYRRERAGGYRATITSRATSRAA